MTDANAKSALQDGLAFERPLMELQGKIDELRKLNTGSHLELTGEIELLEEAGEELSPEVHGRRSSLLGEGQ